MINRSHGSGHHRTGRRNDGLPLPPYRLTSGKRRQSIEQHRFEILVRQAVNSLPDSLLELLGDIAVVVEDEPSPEDLASTDTVEGDTLLGMYQGIPLSDRSASYGMVLPEKITIYRLPIVEACTNRRSIIKEVQRTVVHELAHHFGITDQRLEELGWG